MINRRGFLSSVSMLATGALPTPHLTQPGALSESNRENSGHKTKSYGSGYFGEWVTDGFGLPAYRYDCDQVTDPKAISPVNKEIRSPTDHIHQIGNDRLVAVASNYGYVQVRQDEGSPKFLNDYAPELGQYGGGIGYLSDGEVVLSTYYPGNAGRVERFFGVGYLRKKVAHGDYAVDQVIFAPFGDDPLLISQVTITNHRKSSADLRWVEYWGCRIHQFSFRSYMQAVLQSNETKVVELRRRFGARFAHHFRPVGGHDGLMESKRFFGRAADEEEAWAKVQAALRANPNTLFGGPVGDPANGASMEDLSPPPTFLVSLDSVAHELSANGKAFFGEGGVLHPSGLSPRLDGDLTTSGPESALLLGRQCHLASGESRTMWFAYGYLPKGFDLNALLKAYRKDLSGLWQRSSGKWKDDGLRLQVPSEPWVERELAWHHYYLRSGSTFDAFFDEHIISQGQVYQYVWGFQGAARDPLQYALPLVFSNPQMAKGIVRYTLKEVQPDGSIPYGIVGHGFPMPVAHRPSDLELWLLCAAAEYVLATRDRAFLEESISPYPQSGIPRSRTNVGALLARCYHHLTKTIGTGRHGLLRLSTGDWNDTIVFGFAPPARYPDVIRDAESVLNSAMAGYVLDHYARMLRYAGNLELATEAHEQAEAQRQAVRAQWAGRWFRRAWLTPDLGWARDDVLWLEPQPWAIIGGAATPRQAREVIKAIDELVRRPSPIGAMLQNQGIQLEGLPPGDFANAGVWPSINGTLIWALAMMDGTLAWDEWKKNTLARHADVYPDIWYGIWSGPDYINSVLSKHPGQTFFVDSEGREAQPSRSFWTDFPVMNMHPHSWPLYSAAKLLGLDFTPEGVTLAPSMPLEEYSFRSSLLGFRKSPAGYEGWYDPAAPGEWVIRMTLPAAEAKNVRRAEVNGKKQTLAGRPDNIFELRGESTPGKPLWWSLRK